MELILKSKINSYFLIPRNISLFPGAPGSFSTWNPHANIALFMEPRQAYVTRIPPDFKLVNIFELTEALKVIIKWDLNEDMFRLPCLFG